MRVGDEALHQLLAAADDARGHAPAERLAVHDHVRLVRVRVRVRARVRVRPCQVRVRSSTAGFGLGNVRLDAVELLRAAHGHAEARVDLVEG